MATKTGNLAKRPLDPDVLGGDTDGVGILLAMQRAGKKAAKREAAPQSGKKDVKSAAGSVLTQSGEKKINKVADKPIKPVLRNAKKTNSPEAASSPRARRKP